MMIELKRVSKYYGQTSALEDISFSVGEGEFVSIIGPSGCGKTTILKIVAGLLKPSGGTVRCGGSSADAARRRGELGFVFQDPVLLPWRNVAQNVRLPLELLNDGKPLQKEPERLLGRLGLGEFLKAMPRELSGGMQQRVALARALVFDPKVLLMDEPFASVDELLRERLDAELLGLTEELNQTILFVTHSIPEAVLLSDRVIVLSARPGRTRAVVPVDLKRPRERARGSVDHLGLVQTIRKLLER